MDKFRTPVLNSENQLKLGILESTSGAAVTLADIEGNVRGTCEENVRLAQWADRLGLDAAVPIARWRGYGGAANLGDRSFETFTWATGLMAATERIQAFATIHVPLAPGDDRQDGGDGRPRLGRALRPEHRRRLAHRGARDVRPRPARPRRALRRRRRMGARPQAAVDGRRRGRLPRPLLRPVRRLLRAQARPATLSRRDERGHEPGRPRLRGAPQRPDLRRAHTPRHRRAPDRGHQGARARGGPRDPRVRPRPHRLRRHQRRRRGALRQHPPGTGRYAGARNVVRINVPNSQSADWETLEMQRIVEGMVAGFWALPLVGTADRICATILDLHAAGLDGLALSWPDFDEGLGQLEEAILPRLVEAGLRRAVEPQRQAARMRSA